MDTQKSAVIAEGRWLAAERRRLGRACSTAKVAALASVLAKRHGLDIRIHQQSLSEIEHADEGRGPKKLPPWWRFVRDLFDSGQMEDALNAMSGSGLVPVAPMPAVAVGAEVPPGEYKIVAPNGEVVGTLVWKVPASD